MEKLPVVGLLIISALSLWYVIGTHLEIEHPFGIGIPPDHLLILLVALIGLYLAVDDILTQAKITVRLEGVDNCIKNASSLIVARIGQVDEHVTRARSGQSFTNFGELWSRITHLASEADEEILVIVSNDQFVPQKDWYDGLAARIKQVYEHSETHVRYDLVIDTSKDETAPECQTALNGWSAWKNSLPEYARSFVRITFRKVLTLGVTVVIIDNKHVCICFVSKGKGHTDTGLVFENSNELGARMASWFNLSFDSYLQAHHH